MAIDPIIIAAGLQAAGSIFGNKQPQTSYRHKAMENLNFWQNYQQSEQQHRQAYATNVLGNRLAKQSFYRGIRTKVYDAKQAGLHPLYALGQAAQASIPQGVFPGATPQPAPGQSATGSQAGDVLSSLGNAVTSVQQARQNKIQAAQNQAITAAQVRQLDSQGQLARAQAKDIVYQQMKASKIKTAAAPAFGFHSDGSMLKYVKVYNPLTGKHETMPNPDMGAEMPESYGAALLGRAGAYDLGQGVKSNVTAASPADSYNFAP